MGVTVALNRYRATVHYTDCPYYTGRQSHLNRVVPPSIRWRLCSHCKPEPEDIVEVARDIRWVEKREDLMGDYSNRYSLDDAQEAFSVRHQLSGGRTLKKTRPEA